MKMNLWVRSQNKGTLMQVKILGKTGATIHAYYENGYIELGTYETEERAIEILDEIQSLLQPIIKYEPIVQEEFNPSYEYKHFVKVGDNMEIKELSTFVYRMPEE